MDEDRGGEGIVEPRWRDCGVGFGYIPTLRLTVGRLRCSSGVRNVPSRVSLVCPFSSLLLSLPTIPSLPLMYLERPSATFALRRCCKHKANSWAFLAYSKFSFLCPGVRTDMPFSPSRFIRERDVVVVSSPSPSLSHSLPLFLSFSPSILAVTLAVPPALAVPPDLVSHSSSCSGSLLLSSLPPFVLGRDTPPSLPTVLAPGCDTMSLSRPAI